MKNISPIVLLLLLLTSFSYTQTVNIKDGSSNTLLIIEDEGNSGSITIPPSSPSIWTNKLYNNSGNLYWGANQLGLAGIAGGWTDDGTSIYNTTLTDNVGIGTPTAYTKLHIKSTYDILRIESPTSQGFISIFNTIGSTTAFKGYFGMYHANNDIDIGTVDNNTSGNLNLVTKSTPRVVISPEGNVDIKSGKLIRTGKTNTANLVPIAYGTINADGTIASGTNNFTCNYSSFSNIYSIAISGENYSYKDYVTILTAGFLGSDYAILSASGLLNNLIVQGYGVLADNFIPVSFSFVIYKP